jgi:hypothetical protein
LSVVTVTLKISAAHLHFVPIVLLSASHPLCILQLVILDIPDSGAYFVFDGDNITKEEIFQFIGQICPPSYFAFSFSAPLTYTGKGRGAD